MSLRPYQEVALTKVFAAHGDGARCVALVGPTGMGKTRCGREYGIRQGGHGVFVAHRAELLDQAAEDLSGLDCEFISIQSVDTSVGLPDADWYVIDEAAHYYGSPKWSQSVSVARKGPTLLLTATPERADGTGLGSFADALVVAAQPAELIRDGYLVPCDVIAGKEKTRHLTENPIDAWKRYALGSKCIVFCSDKSHASNVAAEFNTAGIPAANLDGSISETLRKARLSAHRSGELLVLTSIQVLTEGYNDPSVSSAIMARGFSSMGAWIQAIGRVVRPFPGKERAVCIDLRGSVYDWGLPDTDREYSLEGKAMRPKQDTGDAVRQCSGCFRIFLSAAYSEATCPGCGKKSAGKQDPRIRREELARVSAGHTQGKRNEYLAQLRAEAKAKGYKSGWAAWKFKSRYGVWPSG